MKMSDFLADMISFGVEAGVGYKTSMKKVTEAAEVLKILTEGKEEIDVEIFRKMYDTRIYDPQNRQSDIKIMKQHDFEGVFIIHNCTRNIFLVGKSGQVMRKLDREFRGHENPDVYEDYQDGDIFKVKIIRFQNSGYDNLDKMERDFRNKYGEYHRVKVKKEKEKKGFFARLFS